jgi:hypothetical protein
MSFGARNSKDSSAYMLFYKNKSTSEMELEASVIAPSPKNLADQQIELAKIKAGLHT